MKSGDTVGNGISNNSSSKSLDESMLSENINYNYQDFFFYQSNYSYNLVKILLNTIEIINK